MTKRLTSLLLAACFAAAGCSNEGGGVLGEDGPNEFAVLPTAPLETPDSLTALPEPTPGSRNLATRAPDRLVVEALGGDPRLLESDRVPANEQALVVAAGRGGVIPDIRSLLAAQDEEFRRNNRGRPLEVLFGTNVYFRIYGDQSLDAYAELARLRSAGVSTPAAPPRAEEG